MLNNLLLLTNKSKNTLISRIKENLKWFNLLNTNEKKSWLLLIWSKYESPVITIFLWVSMYSLYISFLIFYPDETTPQFVCLYRDEILTFHNAVINLVPNFINFLDSILTISVNLIYKILNKVIEVDYWWDLYVYYDNQLLEMVWKFIYFILELIFENWLYLTWSYYEYKFFLFILDILYYMYELLLENKIFKTLESINIWVWLVIVNGLYADIECLLDNPVADVLFQKSSELAMIFDISLVKIIQTLINLNELSMWVEFHIFKSLLSIMSISVINILLIILFILIGGVIPLLERKYLSLIQRRIGPKFVGYNGRLQFIADAMKLLLKELIYLQNTNKSIITLLPIFVLSINIFLILNVVFLNSIQIVDNNYFLFFMILIELITVILLTYIGFLVKNKYTTIASVRLLNGIIVFEIFTTAVYLYFYLFYNKLSLQCVFIPNPIINKLIVFLLNLPIFINFILILLKRVPYDIIEAETELIMGYSTEHSGFLSGALLLIEYLHIFFWSYFIVIFII